MNICEFLNTSYTAYHTVENVCKILEENGFSPVSLGEKWVLNVGDKRYVTQNGSSVVAFVVGETNVFRICESHTDSPSLKLKGGSIISAGGINRVNTEKYGGGLLYTFFDRPLKIAGRIVFQAENGLRCQNVVSDYNVVIPSLAIHHNPNVNENFSVNLQNDVLPLFSQNEKDLYKTLTDKNVIDADLFAVPSTSAFYAGANEEFLCSPRLDNLTSVYSSVTALTQCRPQNIAVVACLDNEETGSGTFYGSPQFLEQSLSQIENGLNLSSEQRISARQRGMVLSADNGHAVHPAHPEKSDPEMFVKLNGGVVIKHHPNYATDGLSSALFKSLMRRENLPVQDYYNRSDVRCGSTLGLATSRVLQMKTCDIGLAQLAMHSACETVGARDIEQMQKAMKLFMSDEADLR